MLGMFGENCITAERLLVEFEVYAPQPRHNKILNPGPKNSTPPPSPQWKNFKNSKPPPTQENARFLHKYPTV